MSMPALSPEHWRERASQARVVAEWLDDSEASQLLLEAAQRYDEIADIAEKRGLRFKPPARLTI